MRQTTRYADVEIRILSRQGEAYPVEMTLNSEQEYGPGSMSTAELPWLPATDPAADGERLFKWLFADPELRAAWGEIRGSHPRRRVRLRIASAAAELHAVPWELLRDVDGAPVYDLAAAEATPFSRYLAGKWQPGSPVFKRPLKVLVAIADPAGLDAYGLQPIEVETEAALLREAAEGLDLELTFLEQPCTLAALEEALKDGYHVLHFIGHGAFDRELKAAVVFLADADGGLAETSGEAVAAMLARQLADADARAEDKLRLAFLASCQTATRSPADAFRGFAPQLVAAGVPAVVAMQDLVPVETARLFAGNFYRRLLEHGQVDLASNQARSAILTGELPAAAVPVLFQRLRSGTLLARHGRITQEPDSFWPFLIDNLDGGHCVPFLGPRVEAGLICDRARVARYLADKYDYPLKDRDELPRVAQFVELRARKQLPRNVLRFAKRSLLSHLELEPDEKRRLKGLGLSEALDELDWASRILELQETEIHHQLAGFRLPLYVTTNPGGFMAAALANQPGVVPRREGPRWEPPSESPEYVLSPPPSSESPVVFHLNGHDGDDEQQNRMVLSEDDYFAHLVRLASDQNRRLPSQLYRSLANHSILFLGYRLDDWDLRVLLHGLLEPEAKQLEGRVNVAVQLEPEEGVSAEAAVRYLRRYLRRFHLDVYWGTAQEFVTELQERLRVERDSEGWS